MDELQLDPALLDHQGLEVDAMRAAVRQRLFGPEEATRIDRFIVLDRLGSGGMGVVYLAQDPTLGRKVALKLLHGDRARRADAQARLQREARALASLSHPNVVVVHEVGVHDGQLYLVMEHVAGQTLREWTRAHAGDWRSIVAQYRAAGEGLVAAHRAGIIHRDFKPDNVIVDEDGRPRVLDFGLAATGMEPASKGETSWEDLRDVDLTKSGAVLGTPLYMSPEQLLGAAVDARTDQFSFCVALWEALFGERPFVGKDLVALRREVIAGHRREPRSRGRVPRTLVAALSRGLAVDPADRFATMAELLEALAEPRRSGHRAWISVGAAALGGLAVAAWLDREPESASPAPPDPPELAVTEPPPVPERPALVSRRLTHTPGAGVLLACIDPQTQHVLHETSRGELWMLPRTGGDARRIEPPISGSASAHCGPDGTYWLVSDGVIHRVRTDGTVEHVRDIPDASTGLESATGWISPDGTTLALRDGSGFLLWKLTAPDQEPLRFEMDGRALGVAWSPDGRWLAATVNQDDPRLDVFEADGGGLQSSTRLSSVMEGVLAQGMAWAPSGIVVLAFHDTEVWAQCLSVTQTGVEAGRRSAGMVTSPLKTIMGVTADGELIVRWAETRRQLYVLDLSTTPARLQGPLADIRKDKPGAVWLSELELAFLAAEPPGALSKASLDDLERIEPIALGPFDFASADGDGGIVLASTDGTIHHLARGATAPRQVRLPGVAAGSPAIRCRSPRDCLLVSAEKPNVFFGVDLERGHVRRRFACPADHLCAQGRWAWSHGGEEVLILDEQQRRLSRFHAETGRALGEHPPAPRGMLIQSVSETSRGELLLTGMRQSAPPDDDLVANYRLLRLEDDGTYRSIWSSEDMWMARPVASPSGRRVAVEGLVIHGELVALELGSLCDEPQ